MFLLCGVYFTLGNAEFKKNGIKTKAEIVSIEKTYYSKDSEKTDVYVKYSVDDTIYTSRLDYYSDGLREGDIITILYLPDNPHKLTYPKFNAVPQTLFFAGAAICVVFSFVCLMKITINKFNGNKPKEKE